MKIRARRLHTGDVIHMGEGWDLRVTQVRPVEYHGERVKEVVTAQLGPLYPLHFAPTERLEVRR